MMMMMMMMMMTRATITTCMQTMANDRGVTVFSAVNLPVRTGGDGAARKLCKLSVKCLKSI